MNQAGVKRRQIGELSNILALVTILVIGRRVGNNGVTYVMAAVVVYALLWSLICGNLPDTLGRILRSKRNKGEYKNVAQMRKSAMLFQAASGLSGSLVLLLFGSSIAEGILGIDHSGLIVRILSPVVLLQSVSSVLLGYFQGEGSEVPTMISKLLRQIIILVFGILFSGIAGDYGRKVSSLLRQENYTAMYSGVGIAIAIIFAEVLVLLFLALIYKVSSRKRKKARQDVLYSSDSMFDCIRLLCANRWPQLAAACLMLLPLGLGMAVFCGAAEDKAAAVLEFGGYAGRYLVICGMAVALISITILPVIARISVCFRREEARLAKTAFQGGVHICLVHGIFISVYVAVMAAQFITVLWPEDGEAAQQMLAGGSSVIVFAALSCYFAGFLQTSGKRFLIPAAVGIADVIFGLTSVVMRKIGILSLVYGGMTGMFMLCIILGVFSYRQMRMRMNWFGVLIMPLGAGAVAGCVCAMIGKLLSPHIGGLAALLVAFVFAGAAHWALLLLLRNIKEQELDFIMGGRLISFLGQMLRVY